MVLLLPGLQGLLGSVGRVLVFLVGEKFIKELVLQGVCLRRGVGQDVLVSNIVQTRNGVQVSTILYIIFCLPLEVEEELPGVLTVVPEEGD